MLSTAPQPIRNIVFQSAVPKVTCWVTRGWMGARWEWGLSPWRIQGVKGAKGQSPGTPGRGAGRQAGPDSSGDGEKPGLAMPVLPACPGHESEAAATLRHGAASIQPHRPPLSHHPGPAPRQPPEGEGPSYDRAPLRVGAASSPPLTLCLRRLCPRRRFASATSSSSPWATRPTTRWGTWTSSPHRRPGGASRTERGAEGRRRQWDWPLASLSRRLWWPRTPFVPMAISVPGASPLTSVAPSFLNPFPAEPNPAGSWAWVCTAGDFTTGGSLEQRRAMWPWKDLGSLEEAWLPGKGQDLRPSPDPSLGWGHPRLSLMPYGKAQP